MDRLCECGCGEEVTWNKWKSRWNKYINGHQRRGFKATKETRAKIVKSFTGRVHSEETKKKMSLAALGKKKPKTKEHIEKIIQTLTGRKLSKEHRMNIGISHMKPRRDGYCDIWSNKEYVNDLRKGWCEQCGITAMMSLKLFGEKLITHHENGKASCEPDDIKTLCRSCHIRLHNYMRSANINQLR